MKKRWWLPLIVTLAWAGSAQADGGSACPEPTGDATHDRAEAKKLFERALMMEPSDPSMALEHLRCAERLAPRAAIALRMGTIEERLGNLEAAADAFERYLELAGEHAPDREPMKERIAGLRAQAAEQAHHPEDNALPAGDEPAGSETQAVAGWVVGGAGLAFVIVGAALLGAAKAHSDEVHDIEPGTTAWTADEASGTFEQAETEQAVGIVGLAVGGSLMAVGALFILTAGEDDESTAWSLSLGADGHGARGALRVSF